MNKLNLETFNDILFGALKDQGVEGQIKMLKAELNMIGDMLFSETAELLDELEKCGYESERFTRIKNIKSNTEGLLLKLEGLEKKLKEMQYIDDIDNPLEPLKLQSALQSEIFKFNYRKEHKPQDINILDYTVIYALKHCLEEQLKEGVENDKRIQTTRDTI